MVLTALLAVPAAGALTISAVGSSPPRCFGAASRDPRHPCHNPELDRSIVPSLGDALLMPSAPCQLVRTRSPEVCTFGEPESRSRRAVASIGDSHSVHWRAALTGVARAEHWHGYQLYRSSCPFSAAPTVLPAPNNAECERWRRDVPAWMSRHPGVATVLVSEHRVHIAVPAGQSRLQTEVQGYIDAWNALPATVRRIIVIRDTPYDRMTTHGCVSRALAHHRRAGIVCRVPRALALLPDPAAVAARRLNSPRVRVVDLTRYFCGRRYCYPVIGGILVHKDDDHVTTTYSTSLAPYLRRAIDRVA